MVLFRAEEVGEEFGRGLEERYEIYCVSVLSFVFEQFEGNVRQVPYAEYEGIVFPSQRSVISLQRLAIILPSSLKVFAVGESTAKSCSDLLGRLPDVVGKQGARQLCADIIAQCPCSRLIYICGDNQSTLPYLEFREAGVEVLEVCAYGTRAVSCEEINESVREIGKPDLCVFFSPSGVECVTESIRWDWKDIFVIAIGNTTAQALREKIQKCDAIPREFNLNGIKEILVGL